jgi:hypothetical protein
VVRHRASGPLGALLDLSHISCRLLKLVRREGRASVRCLTTAQHLASPRGRAAPVRPSAPMSCLAPMYHLAGVRHSAPILHLARLRLSALMCHLDSMRHVAPIRHPASICHLVPMRHPARVRHSTPGSTASSPPLAIGSDRAIRLPITSCRSNHIKTDIKVVRIDRKMKKWLELIGSWRIRGRPCCYVWGTRVLVRHLR